MQTSTASGSENHNTSSPAGELPAHLGGHLNRTHLDPGALLVIRDTFGIKSMLDVGCGPGGMIELAESVGIQSWGIDGDPYVERQTKHVTIHDYTLGPVDVSHLPMTQFDLAWSVEFLEHVEEKFIDNYMHSFRMCNYVVCTAAPPGWPGHHHVNCRSIDYWVGAFAANGFEYDGKMSGNVRAYSTMPKGFMGRTGMFFRKRGM